MTTELNAKEKTLIQGYIREMVQLFEERDMIQRNDSIFLPVGGLEITQQELLMLEKKLQ